MFLSPINPLINDLPEKYIPNYLNFENFFNKTTGARNPVPIGKEYNDNVRALITMIKELHPGLTEQLAKIRCTNIVNKLQKSMEGDENISFDEGSLSISEDNETNENEVLLMALKIIQRDLSVFHPRR